MGNTNKWSSMTNETIIKAVGEYIKYHRLMQNKTQIEIAESAGINRWTLNQVEKGHAISMNSFIQILRALKQLDILDVFKIEYQPSPIELAKIEQRKRQRASSKPKEDKPNIDW